ncbi:hypothetical protein QVA66_10650 [Staphylococcus chromogenes]|nr:hypothetical protein [Staphylococcus chromogenes]
MDIAQLFDGIFNFVGGLFDVVSGSTESVLGGVEGLFENSSSALSSK